MNETNQILSYKIIPFDVRSFVEKMFNDIIHTPNRKVETLAIFTNNALSDHAIFKSMFAVNNKTVDVFQVSQYLLHNNNDRIFGMQSNEFSRH